MGPGVIKQQLREKYLALRLDMTPGETGQATEAMALRTLELLSTAAKAPECVHLYYPIVAKGEPDTLVLKQYLKKKYPHIQFALSKTLPDGNMSHYLWPEKAEPQNARWGMKEPLPDWPPVNENAFDAVIVPLLAVSAGGHRIGYGKGYYDRMLAHCRKDCLKIGYGFFAPYSPAWEAESHDVPLTHYITPHRTYDF